MKPLRANAQLVVVAFIATIVIYSIATYSDVMFLKFLSAVASGGLMDESRGEVIDSAWATIWKFRIGAMLVTAIFFLMWFHRAHTNLKAGGIRHLRYSPQWAVGGFFIPFLNLVRPFSVMKEVWTGSALLSRSEAKITRRSEATPPLVGWWWALFLVASVLGQISGRWTMGADDLGSWRSATNMTLLADVFQVPAAIVALLLVRRVTHMQEAARNRIVGERMEQTVEA